MATETKINELLLRWEELQEAGRPASAEELCQDSPELLEALKLRIQALQALGPVLETRTSAPAPELLQPTLAEGEGRSHHSSVAPFQTGIPGYQILGELGRGGMGVVYKAKQLSLNRLVALKTMHDARAGSSDLARFRVEAEAVAQLQHPNIVQIYEIGSHENRPYFSLEFIDGGTLDDRLERKPLTAREAAELLEVLARAMHYAHQRGVVHRDLKPSNVLLTADGTPKIADFGLAKRLEGPTLTRTGLVMGTPCYMAPEQATGQTKRIGPRTDVYALGALFYDLLTGQPPFVGNTDLETIQRVVGTEPLRPSSVHPGVPAELETICLKCLEKEPDRRYASAEALADDLQRYLAGQPIEARPLGVWSRGGRWLKRNSVAVALCGLSAALSISVFLFVSLWLKPDPHTVPPDTEPATRTYSDEQIRLKAASLRREVFKRLWQARTRDGWFLDKLSPDVNPDTGREVWAHSQALAALLLAPDMSTKEHSGCVKSLNLLFDRKLRIEKDGVSFGWLAHANADYTIAPPALWTALALTAALDEPGLLKPIIDRPGILRELDYSQRILEIYRPVEFTGGWNFFPRQNNPAQTSTYTTALALFLLLETRSSRLPWQRSLDKRDELLKTTVRWLDSQFVAKADPPGWRETADPTDRVEDGLTLNIYALRLRAEAEAGLAIPPQMFDKIAPHILGCADRKPGYPLTTGQLSYTFINHDGKETNRREAITYLWYPWAIDGAVRWLKRAERQPAPAVLVDRVRQTLGYLVLDQGDAMVKEALSGRTFVASETLYGFSSVPQP